MREREQMLGLPQRERIQARINHYLVRNRTALGMTQSDMAKKLGYSVSAYRSFERSAETENRLVNALETISVFAALEEMNITEFVNFLEKGRSSEEHTKPETAQLRRWETDLLSALKRLDSSIRLKWSEAVIDSRKDLLAKSLSIMSNILKMPVDKVEALRILTDPSQK